MRVFARKRPWGSFALRCAAVVAVMSVLFHTVFSGRWHIGIDLQKVKCIPEYTVWLIDTADASRKIGETYEIRARGLAPAFADGTRLIKRLVAEPGDVVEIGADEKIMVNGIEVGSGLPLASSLKRPARSFYGHAVLAAGRWWVMGTGETSFDSRYWGAIDDDQIMGRAYGLF